MKILIILTNICLELLVTDVYHIACTTTYPYKKKSNKLCRKNR